MISVQLYIQDFPQKITKNLGYITLRSLNLVLSPELKVLLNGLTPKKRFQRKLGNQQAVCLAESILYSRL